MIVKLKEFLNMITLEDWQTGRYREFPEFKTQEGYYEAVDALVEAYGEPTEKDMLLARNGDYKEFLTGKYGCSWTPNSNICRNYAKRWLKDTIYWVFIPAGTKVIHLPQKVDEEHYYVYEEEYVLPMRALGLNNRKTASRAPYNLGIFARHSGEWDWTRDWETEKDADKWAIKSHRMYPIPLLDAFFNAGTSTEDSLTD